jgi:hypothetical protein
VHYGLSQFDAASGNNLFTEVVKQRGPFVDLLWTKSMAVVVNAIPC